MPVKQVSKNCYKYGNTGKKYCGTGAKQKAQAQGRAIQANKKKSK